MKYEPKSFVAVSLCAALACCGGCSGDSQPPTRTVQGQAHSPADMLPPSAKAAGATATYANQQKTAH